MKKRITVTLKHIILICSFILMSVAGLNATGSITYAAPGSTTVYITNTGKCYHDDNCSSLNKSKIKTTLDTATGKGLRPCSKCNPPQLDSGSSNLKDNSIEQPASTSDAMVWQSATGSCYHSKNDCGSMNPKKAKQITETEAKKKGLKKCSKCW